MDGEAAVLDDKGRSDFGMLKRALGRLPSPVESDVILCYDGFDLLIDCGCGSLGRLLSPDEEI
ncbi:DNA ligase-like domain-containing protein [Sinorhizobium meliloti]|uniref:ATP-dependent DNA ligase n=1 Tax=Rhizobium meliloti TaxID=382 RepID=UPI000FDA6824|nr:ATP-dependent DNA ligase [Sinorhizobium meliloti]RVK28124.1 ATP-dependent DNA ligase [Sinorhizobium meliloti]